MRTKEKLWDKLIADLKPYFKGNNNDQESQSGLGIPEIGEIELGLFSLSAVAPHMPARALWVLLTGYPFAAPEYLQMSAEQRQTGWYYAAHSSAFQELTALGAGIGAISQVE